MFESVSILKPRTPHPAGGFYSNSPTMFLVYGLTSNVVSATYEELSNLRYALDRALEEHDGEG